MAESSRLTKQELIDKLMENNLKLQQASLHLLTSMDTLTKKVDDLVTTFKKAAEHIEKGEIKEPLARKLAELLEQNKRIAKGLLLLENFVREREGYSSKASKKEFEDIF